MSLSFRRQQVWFIALCFCIYSFAYFSVRYWKPVPDELVLGVTFDLTVMVPLLFYLFLVRKKRSWTWLFPVILISFLTAHWILPEHEQEVLHTLTTGLIVVEIAFAALIIVKFIRLVHCFRSLDISVPWLERFEIAIYQSWGKGKLSRFILSEFSIFYYVFASPARTAGPSTENGQRFAYRQNSGYTGIYFMVLHALVLEGIGVHFLLQMWSGTAAIIHAALSVYGIIYLTGDYRALGQRPILITGGQLLIRTGVRKHVTIPVQEIEEILPGRVNFEADKNRRDIFKAILMEFDPPQLEIVLKRPVQATGMWGSTYDVSKVYVTVDDLPSFRASIEQAQNAI